MFLLYILAALFLLAVLILLCNVSVDFAVDDDLSFIIRFLFFKFKFPKTEVTKSHSNKRKTEKSEDSKKKNLIKTMIKEKGFSTAISEIMSVIKSILAQFDKLLKHVKISNLKLLINVADEDPAITAVEYGAVCAAVFPIVRIIESKTKLDRSSSHVSVNSDFLTGKSQFSLSAKIKFRLIFGVLAALNVLKELVKLKIKEKDVK